MTPEGEKFFNLLNARKILGNELIKLGHLTDCYMVIYPDDPECYCSCVRNTCPD